MTEQDFFGWKHGLPPRNALCMFKCVTPHQVYLWTGFLGDRHLPVFGSFFWKFTGIAKELR